MLKFCSQHHVYSLHFSMSFHTKKILLKDHTIFGEGTHIKPSPTTVLRKKNKLQLKLKCASYSSSIKHLVHSLSSKMLS